MDRVSSPSQSVALIPIDIMGGYTILVDEYMSMRPLPTHVFVQTGVGPADSIMTGLACGVPSTAAWEVRSGTVSASATIPDPYVISVKQLLGDGMDGDPPLHGGPSGCAGVAALIGCAMESNDSESENCSGRRREATVPGGVRTGPSAAPCPDEPGGWEEGRGWANAGRTSGVRVQASQWSGGDGSKSGSGTGELGQQ